MFRNQSLIIQFYVPEDLFLERLVAHPIDDVADMFFPQTTVNVAVDEIIGILDDLDEGFLVAPFDERPGDPGVFLAGAAQDNHTIGFGF